MSKHSSTSKLLALLLVLVMVVGLLPTMAFAYDQTSEGISASRANISFVFLGKSDIKRNTNGNLNVNNTVNELKATNPTLAAKDIPNGFSLTKDEVIWVGVQVSNMSKLRAFLKSDRSSAADNEGGLYNFVSTVAYDPAYMEPLTNNATALYNAIKIGGAYNLFSEYDWAMADTHYKVNQALTEATVSGLNNSEPLRVASPKFFQIDVALDSDNFGEDYVADARLFFDGARSETDTAPLGDAPMILAVFPFKIKDDANWATIQSTLTTPLLQGVMGPTALKLNTGFSGNVSFNSWDLTRVTSTPTQNLKNYFNATNYNGTEVSDGAISLFAEPAPELAGTVTLDKTAPVYGDTITATVTGANVAANKLVYTWKVGGTAATGNGNKYTVKGGDIGKAITCEVTAGDDATGTLTPQNATSNVAKKTLTLKQAGFNTALADVGNTKYTIYEGNAAAVDMNLSYSLKAANCDGLVNTSDAVSVTMKVTYPANSSAGNPTLTASNFALTGNQAGYYQLASDTAINITGTVKADNVKTVTVQTPPTKVRYSVKTDAEDNVLDLSGLVVTLTYDSGKTKNVALADFAANGITTSPVNGATLTASDTTVTITCNGKNATQALTIEKDATLTNWTVSTTNAFKTAYEVGDTINLTGLTVTATWSEGAPTDETANAVVKFNGVEVHNGDTMTNAMAGAVTVEYNGQPKPANKTITVAAKTSEDVIVTNGTATKPYDNKTDVVWTAEPTFTLSDGTTAVELEGVTYAYADANVGTDKAITANTANAKIKGTATKVNITNPEVLKGNINAVKPTITLGNLSQYAGSVTEVTAVGAPASSEAGDKLVIEYQIPGTPEVPEVPCDAEDPETCDHADCNYVAAVPAGEPTWETWETANAKLNAMAAGSKVNVRAYAPTENTVNYLAGVANEATTGELVLGTRPTSGAAPVVPSHAAYIIGDDNGMFRPNDGMTRAEAAVILARVSDDFNANSIYTTTLRDVSSHWASNWIGFVANKGIVVGDQGAFRPDDGVTRAEMATMVARFIGLAPNNSTYAFADTTGHWAEGYIAALKAAGIVIGDAGNFRPDAPISRAEAVTMINRALERTPDTAKVSAAVTASPFYDVKRSDWFFAQVIEAAVSHKATDYHG